MHTQARDIVLCAEGVCTQLPTMGVHTIVCHVMSSPHFKPFFLYNILPICPCLVQNCTVPNSNQVARPLDLRTLKNFILLPTDRACDIIHIVT